MQALFSWLILSGQLKEKLAVYIVYIFLSVSKVLCR